MTSKELCDFLEDFQNFIAILDIFGILGSIMVFEGFWDFFKILGFWDLDDKCFRLIYRSHAAKKL